jgi:hypothetical protein
MLREDPRQAKRPSRPVHRRMMAGDHFPRGNALPQKSSKRASFPRKRLISGISGCRSENALLARSSHQGVAVSSALHVSFDGI